MSHINSCLLSKNNTSTSFNSNWINVRTFNNYSLHYWVDAAVGYTTSDIDGYLSFVVSNEDESRIKDESNKVMISSYISHPVSIDSLVPPIWVVLGEDSLTGMVNFAFCNWKWFRFIWTASRACQGLISVDLQCKVGIP